MKIIVFQLIGVEFLCDCSLLDILRYLCLSLRLFGLFYLECVYPAYAFVTAAVHGSLMDIHE